MSHYPHFELTKTTEILLTSEAGEKMAVMPNQPFTLHHTSDIQVKVEPTITKQTLFGIGTSFTESAAFVLAHLLPDERLEVMEKLYAASGANFSLTRTPIGSTDFSVEGKRCYAEVENDALLEHFSIAMDSDGFSKATYPGIEDESFDVLPMIKQAQSIKAAQDDDTLNIIASAWTAPPWMKDINTWFIKGSEENHWEGTGGSLKPEYASTYADYLLKYLEHYKEAGIDIWGLTPVNEPHGNSGNWESMHFSAESQNTYVKSVLGPALKESAFSDVRLLIYDQNRDHLVHWTDVILGDPQTAPYVYGTAVHWYSSTVDVYEDVLDKVHESFPDFAIIHTEGCIDDLGKPAPNGILDPVKFQESGWFDNDSFWWNENATDWAYTATWAEHPEDHPIYTPVHRYARDIIVGFNHWMNGWVDWNAVLNAKGGPNHAGNFCGAPIMIDTDTRQVYYTPIYYVLAQLSRTIRPGDKAVRTETILGGLGHDDLHACATVSETALLSVQLLNTTKKPIQLDLGIGSQHALITLPANSLQTVRVQL